MHQLMFVLPIAVRNRMWNFESLTKSHYIQSANDKDDIPNERCALNIYSQHKHVKAELIHILPLTEKDPVQTAFISATHTM